VRKFGCRKTVSRQYPTEKKTIYWLLAPISGIQPFRDA
jgi:hypothetical protein